LNVVLVSVESLSADYSGTYTQGPSLTPHLDALSKDSLVFTRLYASGTRTVRGLEALSLSVRRHRANPSSSARQHRLVQPGRSVQRRRATTRNSSTAATARSTT
jgi:glucan phosphoethanolaminetransferase (alkaline phosphatase superfamily)